MKHIIFDLDGTLLDSIEDLTYSVNHALTRYGLPTRTTKEISAFLGNGIRYLVERAVPEDFADSPMFEQVFEAFRDYYVVHCLDYTKPYEGIMPMLAKLKAQGVRLAIVSNKLQPAVTQIQECYFDGIVDVAIGEGPTLRRKPAPDMVLEAMRQMKATPADSLYVGDTEVDIATAKAAEIPCVAVTWGFRDVDFLRSLSPDYLIDRPDQLTKIALS